MTIQIIRWRNLAFPTILACALSLSACARFNATLERETLVAVISQSGNFLKLYSINSSTGALALTYDLTVSSPREVTANSTDGAVFVNSATTSIECYLPGYRAGSGGLNGSSTAVIGLQGLTVAPDGRHIYYGSSTASRIYFRTLDGCTLGPEQSIAAVDDPVTAFAFSSDGVTVYVVDSDATPSGPHKYSRSTSDGTLSFAASGTGAKAPLRLTPSETVVVSRGTGANCRSFRTSDMGVVTTFGSSTPEAFQFSSSTSFSTESGGVSDGWTLNTSTGAVVTSGISVFQSWVDALGGVAVFGYGGASPIYYVASQTDKKIFRTTGAAVLTYTSAPSGIIVLSGYRSR